MTTTENLPTVEVNSLQEFRENILRIAMYIILALGTIMLAINAKQFYDDRNWAFLIVSIIGYLFALVVTVLGKRFAYNFRAITVLTISYVFTIFAFQNYGLAGDGRIWLLFFVVFTTILFGLQAGIISLIIGAITFLGAGFLILSNALPIQVPEAVPYSMDLSSWVSAGLTLIFTGLILSVSIGLLLQGLERILTGLQQSFETESALSEKLEQEHSSLARRSKDLERRILQNRTAAEISSSLGSILNPRELLRNVVALLKDGFDLYYAAVFLIDENKRYAVLEAGTDAAGQKMLGEGHRLIVGGSSMVGWSTANGEPRISQEVEQESIHFQNPLLPLTRSELALPIKIGSQILGAISIQSIESNAFDEDDIIVLQGIADSLAVALENANLFQQFEDSLKEIQHLNRQYLGESWGNILVEEEKEFSVTQGSEIADDEDTSEIIIPMTLRSDQVIGNIILETDQTEFSSEEREFIDAISSQAALALESARLLDEANLRVEREQTLRNLTDKFALTLDFDQLLQSIVRELGQLPLVKEASIHMSSPINNLVPVTGTLQKDIEDDFTDMEPSEEEQDVE